MRCMFATSTALDVDAMRSSSVQLFEHIGHTSNYCMDCIIAPQSQWFKFASKNPRLHFISLQGPTWVRRRFSDFLTGRGRSQSCLHCSFLTNVVAPTCFEENIAISAESPGLKLNCASFIFRYGVILALFRLKRDEPSILQVQTNTEMAALAISPVLFLTIVTSYADSGR